MASLQNNGGVQSWLTSALEEKAVEKAVLLAASLRKVFTKKKIAVLTTYDLSNELRTKLKEAFDIVLFMMSGFWSEDHAKAEAFSLSLFKKCVYLSPNTVVLKNCDDIFEKYENFAAFKSAEQVDTAVYFFIPSLKYDGLLNKLETLLPNLSLQQQVYASRLFSKRFNNWIRNEFGNCTALQEKHNFKIQFAGLSSQKTGINDVCILNFVGPHPLDFIENNTLWENTIVRANTMEKIAVEWCLNLCEEVNSTNPNSINIISTQQYENEPIAIIGLSFRLPGGNNVKELWDLLEQGKEGIKTLPSSRWQKDQWFTKCYNRNVEAGFLDLPLNEFDTEFFGISPKEAELLDPQQRLLLEVSWEALEDALIDPNSLKGTSTGIFCGSWQYDYRDIAINQNEADFFRTYLGNSVGTQSARLSHFYKTTGPSIGTETGCSAGIVSVHMACKSLQRYESNLALACGVNLILRPFDESTLSAVCSKTGRCKTFDATADGFGRAEGCAVLVLKRLSEAIRDENNIWGLIRGSAITQEGVSKSLGTPTTHCQSLVMELALKDSGVHPEDVSYIEAHGTGTPVGDPMEFASIAKVYSSSKRISPLMIGSVKTNLGHTESVSGITGIIKVLLSLKHQAIPQHINLKTINPAINLQEIPAMIPLKLTPWMATETRKRIAGVSSFGISGTNGHVIIEERPTTYNNKSNRKEFNCNTERPTHIMKISAKSPEALDKLLLKYENIFATKANEISGNVSESFSDFAYTANIGRGNLPHRAVIIASDFTDAAKAIKTKCFLRSKTPQSIGKKLCFLFPGQGSQYPSMAFGHYKSSPVFKETFDNCNEFLTNQYGIDLKDLLWNSAISENNLKEVEEKLSSTIYSQASIFVVEYCLLKLWDSWGVKPDFVLGHSLGEFTAAVASGVLSWQNALMLVTERSFLIDGLPQGKLLVIKADECKVAELILSFQETNANFWLDFAALNSPDQTVVSGDSKNVLDFYKFCQKKQIKSMVLNSSHGFHSRHMDPILTTFQNIFNCGVITSETKKHAPKYISSVTGKIIDLEIICQANYWVRHCREKVNFIDACKALENECNLFLEVGPQPVLSALIKSNFASDVKCMPSLRRGRDEWNTLLEALGNLYVSNWPCDINWKELDIPYKRNRVSLPFYPFCRKPIWMASRYQPGRIHSLLGKPITNASDTNIFECQLHIRSETYLQEHIIGTSEIFPAAGFLEMCLAGGFFTASGFLSLPTDDFFLPKRPIALQSLEIHSPAALNEDPVMQTVVKLYKDVDGFAYKVHVYKENISSDSKSWTHHASANFVSVLNKKSFKIPENIEISSVQNTAVEEYDHSEFYKKISKTGLRFGSTFQSLGNGWKGPNWTLTKLKPFSRKNENYLIHPVLADAMIQSLMLLTLSENFKENDTKLRVPVYIKDFIWLENTFTSENFIYSVVEGSKTYAILLNQMGKSLAYMNGAEFVETNAKVIEGLTQHETTLPGIWEEIYKNTPGPNQEKIILTNDNKQLIAAVELSDVEKEEIEKLQSNSEDETNFHKGLSHLTKMYFLTVLFELGWEPKANQTFTVEEILVNLNISDAYYQYFRFFLKSLGELGYFITSMETSNLKFTVQENVFNRGEIATVFENTKSAVFNGKSIRFGLVKEIGETLAGMLKGQKTPLQILFPGAKSKLPGANGFYKESVTHLSPPIQRVFSNILDLITKSTETHRSSEGKPCLRILEIGAGTGNFSQKFLPVLEKPGFNFEFYYTDISPSFESQASKIFVNHKDKLKFQIFNMEEDPLKQGLIPEYFDIVVCCQVLHVAKDIQKTLFNIRPLLKPGGILFIEETINPCPIYTFIFGLLDGYWRFEDFHLRPEHTTLQLPKWKDVLQETGFCNVVGHPIYQNIHGLIYCNASSKLELSALQSNTNESHSWIVFSGEDKPDEITSHLKNHLNILNRKVFEIVKPPQLTEEGADALISKTLFNAQQDFSLEGIIYLWGLPSLQKCQSLNGLPFVTLCKHVAKLKEKCEAFSPRIVVITQGQFLIEADDVMLNPEAATIIGIEKAVFNELQIIFLHMDLSPLENPLNQIEEVLANLWIKDEPILAFRGSKRFCPKLTKKKIEDKSISVPNDRFQLIHPRTKLIKDLEYRNLDHFSELSPTEIEIEVKAVSLNFRDLLAVLKPIKQFESINVVGSDVAGVIVQCGSKVTKWEVGDKVIALNPCNNLSLPSHIRTDEGFVACLPDKMTFAGGSTLPAVFLTVLHGLVSLAKIQKGETLLLHTASGGVGHCAIQLGKFLGFKIIATAGSKRKRNYLRNLGIQFVFNSRTTEFGKNILKVTEGKGVDVVLNSITGEGFKEASLGALNKNGRFIEMSKLNVWMEDEVKALRPDVSYKIFDLQSLEPDEIKAGFVKLEEFINEGILSPIPYELFDALNIQEAMTFLQKTKHIGKVVCILPEIKVGKLKFEAKTLLFNDRSTYVITGGLGGIGLEVAKFLLQNGAKHLALIGRSLPQSAKKLISNWNDLAYHVEAFSVDVGNFEACAKLFEYLKSNSSGYPPIRGVIHSAGVLKDGIITNQTWSSFEELFNAKINGTWNLHELTKDTPLEHFILFSSMAAKAGTSGQANHAASNSFQDAFAHYRNSIGLPATSVNWSHWGEVGVATHVDLPGLRPLFTKQGILAFETILKLKLSHIVFWNVESLELAATIFPTLKSYIEDKRFFGGDLETSGIGKNIINGEEFWKTVDEAESLEEKQIAFKCLIKKIVKNILKLDRNKNVEDQTDFHSIGVDSLMLIEMKNMLQSLMQNRLSVTTEQLKDNSNTELLAAVLVSNLKSKQSA